ncbi:hypothetical protein [uncultured Shimia sp.]|uniref:hypothetical protein n=1 Tax=uncultured Shimia sp. TaxID=573152 RepID=UPI002605B446|nr:hypothetical protein [uncultured Shimia sp.]
MKHLILPAILLACATTVAAQDVRPMAEFEEDRAKYTAESDLACAGNEEAFGRLLNAADPEKQGNPAALSALAWLVASQNCAYYTGDDEQISYFYLRAAQEGYPVALAYGGVRMIRGLGIPQNTDSGAGLLVLALEGGFGDAGAMLAGELITGIHMPRDLEAAKNLLHAAEAKDADAALLDNVWAAYTAVTQ